MKIAIIKYSVICIFISAVTLFFVTSISKEHSVSYWIWAGITEKDAPPNSDLYVYQGLISKKTNLPIEYRRVGLFPYPIKCRNLFLSYRLEGELPPAEEVISVFQNTVKQWQRHNIVPAGIQLDFDSPTSKLLLYSDFLKGIRDNLPEEYALSITGLGDWAVYGNRNAMERISKTTDEIVFQMYQGWHELPDIDNYIYKLKKYPFPFKIGLLYNNQGNKYIAILKESNNFKGTIYFIQKR